MANVNGTLSRTQSKPELAAQWLFSNTANFRNLLAFALIAALTLISIKFNIELGKLSAVDETSKSLLPWGYALLDLSALFLSGYVGIKSRSIARKITAWGWFIFLLCLSLWAAASFTLSVDARIATTDQVHAIEQQKLIVASLNEDVEIWQTNVAEAVNFKTKHQGKLEQVQTKQQQAANELHTLESELESPTMAIYTLIAPLLSLQPTTLNTIIRLLWAAALTLSPIVIMLLLSTELSAKTSVKTRKHERDKEPQKNAEVTTDSSSQHSIEALVPAHIEHKKGHNGTTNAEQLNGLKYCIEWLKTIEAGRVTRYKLSIVSKIKNRAGVNKVINELIKRGQIIRLKNGQFAKPTKPRLTLVKT